MAARDIETIAADVLDCALSWEPGARLLGNVTALEIGMLARYVAERAPLQPGHPETAGLRARVGALADLWGKSLERLRGIRDKADSVNDSFGCATAAAQVDVLFHCAAQLKAALASGGGEE